MSEAPTGSGSARSLAPPPARRQRVDEIVAELLDLVEVLRAAPGRERRARYDLCVALLRALEAVTGPPFPTRTMNALRHEAAWHVRSLAGLAESNQSRDDQHAAWARSSLEQLARCVRGEQAS